MPNTPLSPPVAGEVTQADREAARQLSEYAGFAWAADHLDMAIEAAAEAFARHRIAALSASAQEPGWRTMESAPRDCMTEIDMWCQGADGGGWNLRGILMIGTPDWIKREDATDYWPHENGGHLTRWQPLPTAPDPVTDTVDLTTGRG